MKKNLFAIIAFVMLTISIVPLYSYATPSTSQTETSIGAPAYWQGYAYYYHRDLGNNVSKLYITVYETPNQCNSFYANATRYVDGQKHKTYDIDIDLVVRQDRNGDYYITYDGLKYTFRM